MLLALERSRFDWELCDGVLEFGCSNGKMLRWLATYAPDRQIWGVDIQADKLMWAMQNLSPPFYFATTTTVPHLPFPDGHFDLIFAGSVFTHIAELHVAWLLELERILSRRGFLYITLHDEASIQVASKSGNSRYARFVERIRRSPFADSLLTGTFSFVCLAPYGTAMLSEVMMSSAYLRHITRPFLHLVHTFPRAYAGFQTGYVFVPIKGRTLGAAHNQALADGA
ncbi:MAG: class I SAM-dependent methyltransferase [Actinomycetota bacterium]